MEILIRGDKLVVTKAIKAHIKKIINKYDLNNYCVFSKKM